MKLHDINLIQAALNIYARHLRGFGDIYQKDIDRALELRQKEIKKNSLCIVIKLDT